MRRLLRSNLTVQSVPDLEEEVVARLRELEGELKPLAEQQQKIETRAYRWDVLSYPGLQVSRQTLDSHDESLGPQD